MPPQPPLAFQTRNNQLYEDQSPFGAAIQIKPKEPTTFSGKMEEDVVSWLNQVNSFFNMIPHINDIQKCCYVGSCLRGAAQEWWSYEGHFHQNNWNDFQMRFSVRFALSTREFEAQTQLTSIHQGQNENVRSYSSRFMALVEKMGAERPKQFLLNLYLCRLQKEIAR